MEQLRYAADEIEGFPDIEEYEAVDRYLDDCEAAMREEMDDLASEEIEEYLDELFEDDVAVNWFYSPNYALGDESPHAYCAAGEQEAVEQVLAGIIYGHPA